MAPKKNNASNKSKGDNKKAADDGDQGKGGGKLKGGQKIEVRHILCKKHSRKEEAMAEIQRLTRGEPAEAGKSTGSEPEPVGKTDPKTKVKMPTHAVFVHVAKRFSEDKASQGGYLGQKAKGSLDPEFERVAYSLQPTENGIVYIGEAKTEWGYHLIVVDKRL
ncbi:hypothetical protein GGR50DRAFT_692024 [Xylaria sp. CBS 124048]|nr:hypothetical protein GGR50DRAFT_692024 [Xylaria sp. CBS 124048]